jgi:hypothetical protein
MGIDRAAALLLLGLGGMPAAAAAQDAGHEAAAAVAERFVGFLRSGDFAGAEAMIAPGIRDRLGAVQLEGVWSQVRSAAGEMKEMRPRGVTDQDTLRVVELLAEFSMPLLLRVVVSPQEEVAGFWIGPAPVGGW